MEYEDIFIDDLIEALKAARANELRLSTLVQASPFCIHEIDLRGQIISMNDAGLRMMGLKDEEDIFGIKYVDLVSSEQRESVTELLGNALEGEYNSFEFSPKNSNLVFASCFAPVMGENGSVDRVMGLTEDVTLQRKNEQELIRAKQLSKIGTLAGGIAHDFNNIMTGIFGNLQLASLKLSNEHPSVKYIKKANDALCEATRLSNQLLTFSEGGKPKVEIINIEDIIRESLSRVFNGSSVKVTRAFQTGLWSVKADKKQLYQAIKIILKNAKQAVNELGAVEVTVKNLDKTNENNGQKNESERIEITISDNGKGIPASNLNRIFDPYFSTKGCARGLGLTTAHSILTQHQGTVSVTSEVGVGSEFRIYLPAEKNANLLPGTGSKFAKRVDSASSLHFLVMDDEPMILDVFSDMLTTLGHTVETSLCGDGALAKITEAIGLGRPFDVVLLDLTIGGGRGGKEIIGELLHLQKNVRAVVVSGYSKDPIMSDPLAFGFYDRLIKPFDLEQLESLIATLS